MNGKTIDDMDTFPKELKRGLDKTMHRDVTKLLENSE